MSDPQAQQEPSMEEILASIRRIISEDEEAPADQQADAGPADEAEPEAESEATPEESPPEETPVVDDEFGDIEFAPSPAAAAAAEEETPEPAPEPVVEDEPQEDVLELTELADEQPAEEALEPEPEPGPAELVEAEDGALISDDTAIEASDALSRLSATVDPAALAPGIAVGGAQTLEEIVRQMLRPLLSEWLDENLPGIVEQAVEQEVRRLSRHQRGRG